MSLHQSAQCDLVRAAHQAGQTVPVWSSFSPVALDLLQPTYTASIKHPHSGQLTVEAPKEVRDAMGIGFVLGYTFVIM